MNDNRRTGTHDPVKPERAAAAAPRSAPKKKKERLSRRDMVVIGLIAAFVLIALLAILLRGAAGKRGYQRYYELAAVSYTEGDYESALGYLRNAAVKEDTEECRMLMVDCYEAMDMPDKALELLRGMDTSRPEIQSRIAALEEARTRQNNAGFVSVAGQDYDPALPALTLKDAGLNDEDLKSVAQLYGLSSLTLSGNDLSDLSPLSALGGLTALDLGHNRISDLRPLSGLSGLRSLYLDANPITDFSPLYSLTNLAMLSIREIEISEQQIAALSAALPNCAIHSETVVEQAQDITLGGLTFKTDVTELDLSGLGLSDISALSACRELRRLDLSGNNVTDLSPLMDIPGLEWLSVKDNRVSDLRPLMAMTTLQALDASGNQITSTAAAGSLSGLQELHLGRNALADCSGLAKLYRLETLGLEETGIKDEALAYLKDLYALRLLDISNNPDLSGEAVDELKQSLPSCLIQHSTLVYSVSFAGQQYKKDITELDLSNSGVTDLSGLSLLNQLEILYLRGNGIEDIYSLQWSWRLRVLDLAGNKIEDAAPLAFLTSLETLDVSNNRITSVTPFMNLTHLRTLDLSGNDIPESELAKLRVALPDCSIIYN